MTVAVVDSQPTFILCAKMCRYLVHGRDSRFKLGTGDKDMEGFEGDEYTKRCLKSQEL